MFLLIFPHSLGNQTENIAKKKKKNQELGNKRKKHTRSRGEFSVTQDGTIVVAAVVVETTVATVVEERMDYLVEKTEFEVETGLLLWLLWSRKQ